jgi:hypothetical protein
MFFGSCRSGYSPTHMITIKSKTATTMTLGIMIFFLIGHLRCRATLPGNLEETWTPIIYGGNLDTHYLSLFLSSFHEFAIRCMKRGEPWLCREANTSKRIKKECVTVSAGASAVRFYTDSTRSQTATSLIACNKNNLSKKNPAVDVRLFGCALLDSSSLR